MDDNGKKKISQEVEPFNDATEHYRNIMGTPTKKVALRSMPKALRWFAYLIYSFIFIGIIALIIGIILQNR